MTRQTAAKLEVFKRDIFDRLPDIFDRTELDPEEKVILSPDFQKLVAAEVAKAVAQIKVPEAPKPEAPKPQIIKEVRVEVPAKDTRDLVERSELEALKKQNEELVKELREVRRKAESPIVLPSHGGSGVIGIPPPEAAPVDYVLTVDADKKAKWKAATGGGAGLSGYTVTNGVEVKTIDVTNISYDDLCKLVGTLIEELQA